MSANTIAAEYMERAEEQTQQAHAATSAAQQELALGLAQTFATLAVAAALNRLAP